MTQYFFWCRILQRRVLDPCSRGCVLYGCRHGKCRAPKIGRSSTKGRKSGGARSPNKEMKEKGGEKAKGENVQENAKGKVRETTEAPQVNNDEREPPNLDTEVEEKIQEIVELTRLIRGEKSLKVQEIEESQGNGLGVLEGEGIQEEGSDWGEEVEENCPESEPGLEGEAWNEHGEGQGEASRVEDGLFGAGMSHFLEVGADSDFPGMGGSAPEWPGSGFDQQVGGPGPGGSELPGQGVEGEPGGALPGARSLGLEGTPRAVFEQRGLDVVGQGYPLLEPIRREEDIARPVRDPWGLPEDSWFGYGPFWGPGNPRSGGQPW